MKRKVSAAILGCAAVVGSAVPAFATQTGTANSDVVGAMTTVANDMTATATAVIPIALSVVGLLLVVKYGLRTFKVASK